MSFSASFGMLDQKRSTSLSTLSGGAAGQLGSGQPHPRMQFQVNPLIDHRKMFADRGNPQDQFVFRAPDGPVYESLDRGDVGETVFKIDHLSTVSEEDEGDFE
jgi:hypothetical protein